MKRNLMGVLAIALALTASAFTVKKHQAAADALYWYDAETHAQINSMPTDQIPSGCDRVNLTDCAYGFSEPQSQVDPNLAEDTVFKP